MIDKKAIRARPMQKTIAKKVEPALTTLVTVVPARTVKEPADPRFTGASAAVRFEAVRGKTPHIRRYALSFFKFTDSLSVHSRKSSFPRECTETLLFRSGFSLCDVFQPGKT